MSEESNAIDRRRTEVRQNGLYEACVGAVMMGCFSGAFVLLAVPKLFPKLVLPVRFRKTQEMVSREKARVVVARHGQVVHRAIAMIGSRIEFLIGPHQSNVLNMWSTVVLRLSAVRN